MDLAAYDLVKVINPVTDPSAPNYRTLHYVHQGRVFDIAPGGSAIVQFDVAAAMFGHPQERDYENNRGRTDGLRRLRLQWGYQEGALNAAELWLSQAPPFRCELLDGSYLPMILDDPEGVLPLPGDPTVVVPVDPSVAALNDTIARMQQQMESMQSMLQQNLDAQTAALAGSDAAASAAVVDIPPTPTDSGIVTDDGPQAPPTAPGTGTTLGA